MECGSSSCAIDNDGYCKQSEYYDVCCQNIPCFSRLFSNYRVAYIFRYLNKPDEESGISPLQLAIYDNSLSVVKALIALDVSLEHLDHEMNSVFHYAAKSSSDIILVNF